MRVLPSFSILLFCFAAQAQTPVATASVKTVPGTKIDVVATMPLPGLDVARAEIPLAIQTAGAKEIEQSGALDLSDFLNRRINGVHLNELQGNPFQPDVNFRGFTASPLLGTPQGISVYLDGVRQNQPFGDVVGWDLIPRNAIQSVTLVPGSDPVFGLNTLGGALVIQTKDGATNPGPALEILYGGSGRKSLAAEYGGGKSAGWNWFFAANAFHESGWRFDSPSDVRQAFARIVWKDFSFSLGYAYNTLTGNGTQDSRLLARDWKSVYTVPDTTANRSPYIALNWKRALNTAWLVHANANFRNIRSEVANGNLNGQSLSASVYQPSAADIAALRAAGYSGFPLSGANAANTPFPYWRCIAQGLQFQKTVEKCNAIDVYSKTAQLVYGLAGQVTRFSTRNRLTIGTAFDRGSVNFTQNTQFGYLNADRSVTGIRAWADGSTNSNGAPYDTRVNLHGTVPNFGLYAADSLRLGNGIHLSFSGRYNRNTVDNRDRIRPGAGPGSLTGLHRYSRFNPSAGATWSPYGTWSAYASFTRGSRAPTSIELGCADPADPCTLPNSLASDPPLKQVVTTTWEAGLRGAGEGRRYSWSIGAFRAENRDDILFVAALQTGSGYFKNFGRTRRRGVQANVDYTSGDATWHRLTSGVDYTFLDATYQSAETVDGAGNSTNDAALAGLPGTAGTIEIQPGNRIPLTPRHTAKVYAVWQPFIRLSFNGGFTAASKSYARGNENNLSRPDGKYYLSPGISPGYGTLNFLGKWQIARRFEVGVRLENALDRHYYTGAQLGSTGFTADGRYVARPFPVNSSGDYPLIHGTFFAPGAPRRAWVELRVKLN